MTLVLFTGPLNLQAQGASVAREWNEACLDAIRIDFPAPTVHARNLFHLSIAMYDAWAAFDTNAPAALHHEEATAPDIEAARHEAISYAAFRLLTNRYARAVDPGTTITALVSRMTGLGYDPFITTTSGPSPAAVGNRCAATVLAFGLYDGANETGNYNDTTGYLPINDPLVLALRQTNELDDKNRWQPLAFEFAQTQNGLIVDNVQVFVSPHWGYVEPFALNGPWSGGVFVSYDPGIPPLLGGDGSDAFKEGILTVLDYSSRLDPDSGDVIDISPASRGNNTLGTNDGTGHPVNPATGQPYPANLVKHGDFGRVIAEFWADGPDSETPPGHWNVIANQVSDDTQTVKRIAGQGPVLSDLEWDVKLYLVLNGALHDAAVAAWGVKARYDYIRPVSSIRYMGGVLNPIDGTNHPSFLANGIPLVSNLVEEITPASTAPGQRHAHLTTNFVGFMAVNTWPGNPTNTSYQGRQWILAVDWVPYQQSTFVTPAFAGYVSGHSAFSRAAAEVLTEFTGSAYFPGGMAAHTVPAGHLEFELGPSENITIQWATYYDAADEAGISRLYGGIHVPADDGPGRILGSNVGKAAFQRAAPYLFGQAPNDFQLELVANENQRIITWWPRHGASYKVLKGSRPDQLTGATAFEFYDGFQAIYVDPSGDDRGFFSVMEASDR